MGIDVIGKLHTIFETKQMSERFTKREFVVELADNPKYPQVVLFQLSGERCAQLDNFRVGDEIRIEFSLRGREWRSPQGETKYFNSLDVWKIEPARAQASSNRGQGQYSNNNSGGGGGGYGRPQQGGQPPRGGDAPPPEFDPRPSDDLSRDADDIPF